MATVMFPAHAGMNRERHDVCYRGGYVPRTRGDEPGVNFVQARGALCSPHTRG